MKDRISLIISIIAITIALYNFGVRKVGLNSIVTDTSITSSAGTLDVQIVFQNHGNVDMIVSELEIYDAESDREGLTACKSGKKRKSENIRTASSWAHVKAGTLTVGEFQMTDPISDEVRLHYCARYEAHDVYGEKYDAIQHITSISYLEENGQYGAIGRNLDETAVPIANGWYLFRL